MKLRLHIDEFELSGYTNIRVPVESAVQMDQYDFNLDKGEAEELIIENLIDYIPISKVEGVIKNWSEFLKKQGKLVITGTDLQEVAKNLANYNISIPDANELIYGLGDEPKRVCFSIAHLSAFLKERCNLRILKKRVNGYLYMVEAQR